MRSTQKSLAEMYLHSFHVHKDVSAHRRNLDHALRLRYAVYCVENRFEPTDRFPTGRETDRYDARAIHSLLVHRQSHQPVGTVRLVLPDLRQPVGSLPIDSLCKHPMLRLAGGLPRESTAEVSRFAISKAFRRRINDGHAPLLGDATVESDIRRHIPHLCLGLIRALVANSRTHGVTHWVAEMEPGLLRMLSRLGIKFIALGPRILYHGIRQPCYIQLEIMLQTVRAYRPDIWEVITDDGHLSQASTMRMPAVRAG